MIVKIDFLHLIKAETLVICVACQVGAQWCLDTIKLLFRYHVLYVHRQEEGSFVFYIPDDRE